MGPALAAIRHELAERLHTATATPADKLGTITAAAVRALRAAIDADDIAGAYRPRLRTDVYLDSCGS